MSERNVTVLGAGVVGLTTALLLSRDPRYRITVAAKHMPGDYDGEYASPWAGANYEPVGQPGSNLARFERNTWADLQRLAAHVPEAGIHFQDTLVYNRLKDADSPSKQLYSEMFSEKPWFHDVVPDFRTLRKDELPPGYDSGNRFTSVCINVMIYVPWLLGQCLKNGVKIRRAVVQHISEAAKIHHNGEADVVVNCTGISSRFLGGVEDKTVFPARGQVVVVRNEAPAMYAVSGTDHSTDETSYIMMRAAGGGTILGGCAQKESWDMRVDENLTARILQRADKLCPELAGGKGVTGLSIIRVGVGLRPVREDGPRVEKERIGSTRVVHNYGHGGWGYQASYGSAMEAKALVDECFQERARL